MTRAQLEHAIRAACDVAEDSELWLEAADKIDGALGELSQFHRTHGFYVHGLSLDAATLPDGWKDRTNKIQNPNTKNYAGHCVEAHDLAASKLVAFRDKDREFVRILLNENLIHPETLVARVESLPCGSEERTRLAEWIKRTVED